MKVTYKMVKPMNVRSRLAQRCLGNSDKQTTMATILNEKDVPGAAFVYADVAKHDIAQLKRWLQCQGLKRSGRKEELVRR